MTLLREEGSGKRSVLFFEVAKCSQKLHFYRNGSDRKAVKFSRVEVET